MRKEDLLNIDFKVNDVTINNDNILSIDYDVYNLPKEKIPEFEDLLKELILSELNRLIQEESINETRKN